MPNLIVFAVPNETIYTLNFFSLISLDI